jgi:hypothetical protein
MTVQEVRQQEIDRLRNTLADGMSSVRASETTTGLATMTFEEMLARSIADIETDESDIRPSKLSVVRQVKQSVADAVDRALKLPASMFNLSDERTVSNTRSDGSGPGESE